MKGWARHIINNIYHELDDTWRYWIQWPSTVINVDEKVLTNGSLRSPISGHAVHADFDSMIDGDLNIPAQERKASN